MTDFEITRLCAEAMGWTHLGAVGVDLSGIKYPSEADAKFPGKLWCLSGHNDWWKDPDGFSVCAPCQGIPDPLHDDAQVMALVKKFQLCIVWIGIDIGWRVLKQDGPIADHVSLSRAICECVAKMQTTSARQSESAGKRSTG